MTTLRQATDAPWRVDNIYENFQIIRGGEYAPNGQDYVASVRLRPEWPAKLLARRAANMRLIVAAPDLAAFADLVVGNTSDLDTYGEEELRVRLRALREKARWLLAKLETPNPDAPKGA